MTQKLISALIIAHNEEDNLDACLKQLDFADEIVVVLDKCTDKSKEIAAKYTDNIIEGSWNIEGARRNVGLDNCSGKWILELDADERISDELKAEIVTTLKDSEPCCFTIPIANYIGQRYVKYGWLRTLCVEERQTIHYQGYKKYHEDKEVHPTADIKGEIKYLKNPIKHLVDKDIADFVNRFNRYTSWKARDMVANGKMKGGLFSNCLNFFHRFIKSFIFKKGYKEGSIGFLIAIFSGLYPLLSYFKALEISQQKINKNHD
ncbi:MAG: glycosyltransferase family 2 protein [Proteobacteria bacterium]|nr:glycosyltransferase family 2 protein [Pseudomonadota bacterium]